MLHQLVVGGEGFETLLALVWLDLAPVGVAVMHLHGRFVHKYLVFPLEGEILHFRRGRAIVLHAVHGCRGEDGYCLRSKLFKKDLLFAGSFYKELLFFLSSDWVRLLLALLQV